MTIMLHHQDLQYLSSRIEIACHQHSEVSLTQDGNVMDIARADF